ncbi:MAG: T9SS type A sorting domain-containing protein [Bacteroidetes bacterium]|nr:T9SS type A sorting domain-containing protein [Bacteroidota bacterium]
MTGGPAVTGGFNIAIRYGAIDSVDTLSHRMLFLEGFPLELTHTMPNAFINDTVFWNFKYTAPDSSVVDTIYSVANSVNGDGIPFNDQWNFGANFPVSVVDIPVTVEDETLPSQFHLAQNYPNPFNPNTIIKFTIPSSVIASGTKQSQLVTLKVYDVLGSEVTSLVNEEKSAGVYEVEFDGNGLTSGIYFYRLQAGDPSTGSGQSFIDVKKMILLK